MCFYILGEIACGALVLVSFSDFNSNCSLIHASRKVYTQCHSIEMLIYMIMIIAFIASLISIFSWYLVFLLFSEIGDVLAVSLRC